MINVVNKHKHKKTNFDIYIGRGSSLGNPFTHLNKDDTKAQFQCETRDEAISNYDNYIRKKIFEKDELICKELNKIYLMSLRNDVNLVCYCKPKSCHGDIIKNIIEEKMFELDNLIDL